MKENLIENHWDQFLMNPLNVIDRLYNQMNGESSIEEFHYLIKDQLIDLFKSDSSKLEQIPFLNNRNTNYESIKNKSIVRYRCMIQDMFNPEIYAAILNSPNGKKINLYTDSVCLDEEYSINPNKNTIMDRFIYYMISIPGVNEWVKQCWDKEGRMEKDYCASIKKEENLNRPVIAKVYDSKELELKLNDLVEIVGIIEYPNVENRLSIDQKMDDKNCPEISSMLNSLDLDHEDHVYSEIPRVHILHLKKLNSINPFNDFNLETCSTKNSTHPKLINLFEKMFFGDQLVAQYFTCWLVSRVYKVQDSLPIGNFPINISNLNKIPDHAQFIKNFYSILENLCTHSLNFPITISELNNRVLNPHKDKDNTKLQTALLQLPANFSLILDETSLQPGNLKEMGIKNLSTIKELITWQSVEYDHLFYTQRINSDINVLVFSEGKSLFEVNCEIKLKPVDHSPNIEEQFNLIKLCLDDNLVEEFRNYLNYVRTLNCEIPEDLQKKIQDDFVIMRRNSSAKTGPKICSDDLHQFLSLSRLLAMSEGSSVLCDQHWEKAKSMEFERRLRTN